MKRVRSPVQCNPCQSSVRSDSIHPAREPQPGCRHPRRTRPPPPHKTRHRRNTCFGFDTYPTPTMQQQSTTVAHNALPPPSSTTVARSSRISVHSHIKGLGLTQDGYAASDAAGFIGQTNAREVLFVLYHPVQGESQSLGSPPRPAASSWTLSSRVNSLAVPFSSSVPPEPVKPPWLSPSRKSSAQKFPSALWSVPRSIAQR